MQHGCKTAGENGHIHDYSYRIKTISCQGLLPETQQFYIYPPGSSSCPTKPINASQLSNRYRLKKT
ncbi:MAG: hypothetical protein FWG66_03590, partial [Spirochaetes bacterium]|nr:hypothetical protein [Spirochaetota bacterium]